jgi:CelD/BcsL family acetyltransferase involved in cellulose biosynthesis
LDARLPPATARDRRLPPSGDNAAPRAALRRPFASVEVLTDVECGRPAWIEISAHARASPYQSFEFALHWSQTIGAASGVTPWIVVARDDRGAIRALLPLGRFRRGPIRWAAFLGGRLANFQMGLFRAGVEWTHADLGALLREAAALASSGIDAYMLANQPFIWDGARNPFAALGTQSSPSDAYSSALPDSFSVWRDAHLSRATQKKLSKKTKRLKAIGPLTHLRASRDEEARVVIDAFLLQKRARMHALGLPNEFDGEPTVALLTRLSGGDAPILELHALRVDERIIATFAGVSDGTRLSGLFLSHDMDPEVAASSPGELLIMEVVRDAIARGFSAFDLGVGEARYKNECCEITEALFDSALPISVAGRGAAAAFLAARRMKRRLKQSPRLFRLAIRARRFLSWPTLV